VLESIFQIKVDVDLSQKIPQNKKLAQESDSRSVIFVLEQGDFS